MAGKPPGGPVSAPLPAFATDLRILVPGPEQPALIGVSGGRDSVALLHLLLARGWPRLIVCHFDHGLRAASAEDASFVEDLASRHALPFFVERCDVAALAAAQRSSIETAARDARYAFFARIAREEQCPRIFLAHQADDQVETFLFNLFRGAGAAGLRGMRPRARRTIDGVALEILRPLLGVWRAEIDAYIAAAGLAYREDLSNAEPGATRNRLRHRLLPVIEEAFGRDVRSAVWRTAEILGAEEEWISALPELVDPLPEELSAARVKVLPVALQRRLLQRWLRARGVANVGYEEVEAVRALLAGGRPAKVNLAGGKHARRRAGTLFVEG
jgi:tRNA(Ile)-lysidine synthase